MSCRRLTEVERATRNVQRFFEGVRRDELRRVRALVREHAADARAAGNPDGARRLEAMGRDLVGALR